MSDPEIQTTLVGSSPRIKEIMSRKDGLRVIRLLLIDKRLVVHVSVPPEEVSDGYNHLKLQKFMERAEPAVVLPPELTEQ
jgi:hypothetical protein